jgi:hypothetical protein
MSLSTLTYIKITYKVLKFVHNKTFDEIVDEVDDGFYHVTEEIRTFASNLYNKLHKEEKEK